MPFDARPVIDVHFPQSDTCSELTLTPLSVMAKAVNDGHRKVQTLEASAKDIAAEIGEVLIKVKQELAHGEFKPWVADHCSFSYPQAARYMQVAKVKSITRDIFDRATSIREVLDLRDNKKEPSGSAKAERRAATLDDLRRVEKLRAQRDCPTTNENVRATCQAKLDEIEKDIGKVEPSVEKAKTKMVKHELAKQATEIVMAGVFEHERAFEIVCHALEKTYGTDEARLKKLVAVLNSYKKT